MNIKQNFRTGITSLMVALFLSLGYTAMAQSPNADPATASPKGEYAPHPGKGHHRGGHHGHHMKRMIMNLPGMTEAQLTEIRSIMKTNRAEAKPMRMEMKGKKEALEGMMDSGQPDMSQVFKLVEEIHALKAELTKKRLQTHLEVEKVLTPEQKTELVKRKQAMKEMRKEMRQRMKEIHGGEQDGDGPEEY